MEGNLTNTILDEARPAEGGISGEDRLVVSQAKVDNALAAQAVAQTQGDPHSIASALKAVSIAVGQHAALAKVHL